MTTIINLSSDIKNLRDDITNFEDIAEFEDIETQATDYRFYSNQEILIYNNRETLYSCSYTQYKNNIYITHIYNRESELVYYYEIDYNS